MQQITDGWFECQGPPTEDGKYLARFDESDEEPEYAVYIVKGGKVFKEDGRQMMVWNVQWKRTE